MAIQVVLGGVTESITLSLPAKFPSNKLVVPKVCASAAVLRSSSKLKAIIMKLGFFIITVENEFFNCIGRWNKRIDPDSSKFKIHDQQIQK